MTNERISEHKKHIHKKSEKSESPFAEFLLFL